MDTLKEYLRELPALSLAKRQGFVEGADNRHGRRQREALLRAETKRRARAERRKAAKAA